MAEQTDPKAAEPKAPPTPAAAAPPKPAAKGKKAEASPAEKVDKSRRTMIWACIWGYLGINFLMFLRFFFPRAHLRTQSDFFDRLSGGFRAGN